MMLIPKISSDVAVAAWDGNTIMSPVTAHLLCDLTDAYAASLSLQRRSLCVEYEL